ncbi:MAG: ferritin [Actinomycetota bacterium]
MEKKIETALNEHLRNEMQAGYQYLSMAAFAASMNLPGTAHWFHMQMREELIHMMRFFTFINDRGGTVTLGAIDAPKTGFKTVIDAFQAALENEQTVTGEVNDLYELAANQKDWATMTFMQTFVTEQVEEEAEVMRLVETLKMVGDNRGALLLIDRELGSRPEPSVGA